MRSKDLCGAGQWENCCYLCPSVDSRGLSSLLPDCGFAGLTFLWFRGVLFLLYACLWVRGAHLSVVSRGAILYYLTVCGFAGLTRLWFRGVLFFTICLTVVSRGLPECASAWHFVLSFLLLSFCHEWQFYLCWALLAFTFTLSFTIFMFRGWCRFLGSFLHHGYEPARWVLRPWLSFLSFLVLCPCCYLLAQQEGEVF